MDKIPRHRGHGLVVAQALQPQATILVIPLAEKLIERPQESDAARSSSNTRAPKHWPDLRESLRSWFRRSGIWEKTE